MNPFPYSKQQLSHIFSNTERSSETINIEVQAKKFDIDMFMIQYNNQNDFPAQYMIPIKTDSCSSNSYSSFTGNCIA